MIPLINGKRGEIEEKLKSVMQLHEQAQLLQFGHLEEVLKVHLNMKPLGVISVIGRQSGGKSYLMNRLWGTRFSVAATRCTDGIWMSIAYIYGKPLLILDCEGLFSQRRTEMEETKLLTALAAVCDITILN